MTEKDKQAESVETTVDDKKETAIAAQKEQDDTAKLLAELKQKNEELENKYLRAAAEIQNMTRRFKKEQEQLLRYEGQSLARDILPVVDNLQRALLTEADDDASRQLKHGIELVAKDLEKALKDNKITQIDALNQPFDPQIHQAVKTVPAENEDQKDHVIEVYQEGYLLRDRVLRPAMVVVAQ
ncbi:nucleotide exchange factor GrpE [Ligilactobacillus saerimneri]|uniref:nucleotide exchange factor GrpE n=1 Tax=Ligilactobacillus saerimneri TaxID=228229 RepID=UPI0024B0DF4F|nr:nucleotide exchange factor GrpE [Ligilactobacillus saerimneri]MDI9205647.1 nucleotide exchange factor GrpE [Ligilactobacillus saerimneri]